MISPSQLGIGRASDCIGGAVAPIMGRRAPPPLLADVGTPFKGDPCDCHELEGDGIIDWSLKFSTPELVEALELDTLPAGSMVEFVVSR